MGDGEWPDEAVQWVIWNGSSGMLAMATIGRVEHGSAGGSAWMAPPFDMVGPFSLDELLAGGCVNFAACIVMSRQRWQEDQKALRTEAYKKRRAAQEWLHSGHSRYTHGRSRRNPLSQQVDERQLRETLNLPIDGALERSQIKAAFRRLARWRKP